MRILILALERYGPFTGRTLAFRPGASLHIVYGANEAGKSCSLAAIGDLFFEIERNTRQDFVHDGKDLRIGATIERRDGSRLTFQRRKGNKNTLLDTSGAPVGDNTLLPFLGSLSREVFCHAFGLDTERLRAGAEEMLKSGGEVGASLFAAASGLRGMIDIRTSMDVDADGIFAPRASKDRTFYQALERFEAARTGIRNLELRAPDWKALNVRINDLGARLEQIKQDRTNIAVKQARLSRLKRMAPLLRRIDQDLGDLAKLGEFPDVPDGFTQSLRSALEGLDNAAQGLQTAETADREAKQDLADIVVNEALIAKSSDIQRLFAETGAYANNLKDLPRVQVEENEFSAALKRLAARLGLSDNAKLLDKLPTDAALARVKSLTTKGRKLEQTSQDRRQALASETKALATLLENRKKQGAIIDPGPIRERLVALAPVLKMLGRRVEVEATITDESRSLREAAGRLSPPVIDLEALARASMPAPETVARFTRQLEEIDGNIRQSSEHAADAVRSENAIEDELRKLEAGGPVPSAEAISDARAERDRAWTRLREALVGAAEPLVGPRLLDTVASFERYGTEADRLADLAASDATRVAAHAAARRRRDEERGKISNAASRSEALAEERRFLLEKWSEVWRPTSIGPPPPADMAFWIERVSALLERREKLAKLESERDRVDVEVETIRPALEAIARDIALPAMDGLGVGLLASRIEDCLETRDRGWGDARDLETQCRVAQERIDHLCEEQKDTNEQLELWSSHWREAVGALGLPANATVDEAEAAIQVWKEVPGKLHERDNRARRVAGMQRDIDRFEEQIAPLVESIAPDLRSLPSNLAMERLNELLASALRAEARRGDATKRLAVASDALKNFRDRHQQARDRLLTLATKLPPSTDLPDLLQRLAQRDNITTALAERKGQVVVQGDGFSEDQLRSDLATFDADQADAALKTLETDDENLDGQAKIIFAEQDRELRKRQDLEQGIGAELVIQMRRNAETELLDAAREWTVLTLGSLLIGHVIERHRASQKGPLMARAGALFSMLTGGAFASIDQDFGDDDTPRLVACRSSGEQVPVAGLSEGTRDQLYLALRLAYLEDYASRAEAVPFVGDDLFTSFDEERTANGLAALAEIGTKIQPILFTHHRHVVEIARTAIGTALDVIELE